MSDNLVDPELAELQCRMKAAAQPAPAKEQTASKPATDPVKLAQDWRDHVQTCTQCKSDPLNPCPWGKGVQDLIPEPLMREFRALLNDNRIKQILLNPNK